MDEQQIKTFDDFLKHGQYLRGWSKTTLRTYRQAWTSFQQSQRDSDNVSSEPIITKAQLEAWVIWLRQKGVTPGGCNMYIRTMNSYLSWLKEEGQLQTTLRVKLLPNPPKPLQGFSDIEIRSLLSFRPRGFTELRTSTLICLLLDTGMRIDEALTLSSVAIDLDNFVMRVTGKGNKQRLVPFSIELRPKLFKLTQVSRCKVFVFSTHGGGRLSYRNTYRDIKTLCAKAGVEGPHVHPHAFRHCFAVCYIRRGGDIYRLSRILGHTSISTTQLYLRSMGIEQIAENHSSLSPLSRG